MQISDKGIDFIVDFEGKKTLLPDGRYKAYLDTLAKPPVWTIYTGLTKGVHEGMIITEDQGKRMFASELGYYQASMERLIKVKLTQSEWDALCSFTYNCGVGALEKSTLLKELNRGNFAAVPAQLKRWNKAGGKVRGGLVRRRNAEADMFASDTIESTANAADSRHLTIPAADPPHELPDDHMPQRPEISNGSMSEAAQQSWTIRGAAAAIVASLVQGWDWLFGTAQQAGAEIAAIKTATGPFDALLLAVKVNMTGIAIMTVIIGCSIAIIRRLHAAREMKNG